jgi:D-arabinose 1-dehydrogenase-like Zn-dependent alcohol dehydrogenase
MIGTICKVGEKVKNFKPGDRVAYGVFEQYCGECETCMTGHHEICPLRRGAYDPNFGGYNTHF